MTELNFKLNFLVSAVLFAACGAPITGGIAPSPDGSTGNPDYLAPGTPAPGTPAPAPDAGTTAPAPTPTPTPTPAPTPGAIVNSNPKAKPDPTFVPVPAYTANPKFTELLPKEKYEELFPQRAGLYSYEALAAAAAKFPDFISVGTLEERKRELAAFLANIAHETTGGWDSAPGGRYSYGLYFVQEVNCDIFACKQYCDVANVQYPCVPGKTYHGRGPIQLSWNYNYGLAGADLGYDLLNNPDQIVRDPYLAFLTGIWFWMRPQDPKPSCHDAMTGKWVPSDSDKAKNRLPGFGMTNVVINGGVECGYGVKPSDQSQNRIEHFKFFSNIMGIDPGPNLTCNTTTPYW